MCKVSEIAREVDHQDENLNCANRNEIDDSYHKEELREIFKEEYERLLNDNGFIRQNLEGRFAHRIAVSSSVSLNQLWRHLNRINSAFLPQKSQISNTGVVSEDGQSNSALNTAGSQELRFMKLKIDIADCQSPNLCTELKELVEEEESEFASIDSQQGDEDDDEEDDYLSAEFSEVEERIDKISHLATGTNDLLNNEDGSEQMAESDASSDDTAATQDEAIASNEAPPPPPNHHNDDDPDELKAWYLRGEVKNNERPLNSLIEKELEFAVNQKIVPKAKELTEEIEMLLKQRVKDQVFNDVIPRSDGRREKINNVYQAQIQLNSEKSKKNLETIYEEQFGSNKDNIEQTVVSELKQKHEDIEKKMNNLFAELDLICHFNLSSNNFENLKHKMHTENNKSSNLPNRTLNLPDDSSDAKQNEIPINFATISTNALENSIDSKKSNSLDNCKLQDYANKSLPPISSSSSSHRELNDAEQLKRRERRLIKIKKQAKNNERIRRVKQKNPEMPMKTVKEHIRLQKGRYFSSTKNNLKKSPPSSNKTKLTTSFASKL